MSEKSFHIVDVFAEEKYAGNQLAVFLDAEEIPEPVKPKLAREMNFSETTFILSDDMREGGYDTRIFTPGGEIPFAGHPTLGTAFVIQKELIRRPVERVTLNLQVGPIPVSFSYKDGEPDLLWMKQNPPEFGEILDKRDTAAVLGLEETCIDDRFPVQTVSTGLPATIIPLKTLKDVESVRINRDLYFAFVEEREGKALLVFSRETLSTDNQLHVRVFVDYYGVPEDPATGSANGCLAGYLARYRYFGDPSVDIRVEQGYEIGRPSRLYLKAEDSDQGVSVSVGGRVQAVAKGILT